MRQIISCVETHTCGEPTRIITGGLLNVPGNTMVAKQAYVRDHLDHVRRALIREPRGHRGMFGAILTPPVSANAVGGVIWFDTGGYLSGCGHGTIGVGVAMVETGMVPATEPVTEFVLDSPSGPLALSVKIANGHARETTFVNVPAISVVSDAKVEVAGLGPLTLDVAFGGNFFGILDAAHVGLEVRPAVASRLAEIGIRIRDAVNEQIPIRHPTLTHLDKLQIVTFRSVPTRADARCLHTHMFGDGSIDRSAGGTGTSAVMTALHAKGQLAIGEELRAEGIAGGIFRGRLLRETTLVLDADDPWIDGFEMQ